jgi:hypothetical protein
MWHNLSVPGYLVQFCVVLFHMALLHVVVLGYVVSVYGTGYNSASAYCIVLLK